MLTEKELQRYDRQIMIDGFGEEGQEKLKKAKVFIAGAGGLGSPVAIYLAAAGIGTLRIADHDKVELSNLNRQVLHWEENIGEKKSGFGGGQAEKIQLRHQNRDHRRDDNRSQCRRNSSADSDLIVDAMDNLPTRYLLNKTAIEKDIPFFHGAVYGFEGRAMTVLPGKTACLNCLYHGATFPKRNSRLSASRRRLSVVSRPPR